MDCPADRSPHNIAYTGDFTASLTLKLSNCVDILSWHFTPTLCGFYSWCLNLYHRSHFNMELFIRSAVYATLAETYSIFLPSSNSIKTPVHRVKRYSTRNINQIAALSVFRIMLCNPLPNFHDQSAILKTYWLHNPPPEPTTMENAGGICAPNNMLDVLN